jgi:hypothetical protein
MSEYMFVFWLAVGLATTIALFVGAVESSSGCSNFEDFYKVFGISFAGIFILIIGLGFARVQYIHAYKTPAKEVNIEVNSIENIKHDTIWVSKPCPDSKDWSR